MNLVPGFKVTPAVELLSILGKGGMGDVWLAQHSGLACQVVVKFLSIDLSENDDAVARFKREAASAAAVKSPHVVQVFDHGVTADGVPFIVMEYLEGNDLSKLIAAGSLRVADVAEIVAQVGRALARAHQAGIVHRDIKPENIFLCESGDGEVFVKLLDFGIAKAEAKVSRATATGQIVGTPYYMSPEQIVGARTDPKVDLWALASVTFEALTGKVAFDGDTVGAITLAIHGAPPVPSRLRSDLTPEIDAWFAKAFAKDAANRFASAKEMASAFQQAVRGSADISSQLNFRGPLPSIDMSRETGSQPSFEVDSRAALASTHLSATIGINVAEAARRPSRARALRILVPVLGLAFLVLVGGLWRLKSDSLAAATKASGVAPSTTASALLPVDTLVPIPSTSTSDTLTPTPTPTSEASAAPASSVAGLPSKGKPGAVKPAVPGLPGKPLPGKPKPGKYDDIQ